MTKQSMDRFNPVDTVNNFKQSVSISPPATDIMDCHGPATGHTNSDGRPAGRPYKIIN